MQPTHLSVNERSMYTSPLLPALHSVIQWMHVCMRAHDADMFGHNTQLRQCNIRVNQ